MKEIDSYIDSVYIHMDEKSEEVQALKYEMKEHLLQVVNELKTEGKSEDESVKIAIDRFGEGLQIRDELTQVLKFQKFIAMNILKLAVISLIICIGSLIISYIVHKNFNTRFNAMDNQVHTVHNKLTTEGIQNTEKYLKELFKQDNNQLTYVRLSQLPKDYNKDRFMDAPSELTFVFPEEVKSEYHSNEFGEVIKIDGIDYVLMTGVKTSANTDSSDMFNGIAVLFALISLAIGLIWVNVNSVKIKELVRSARSK